MPLVPPRLVLGYLALSDIEEITRLVNQGGVTFVLVAVVLVLGYIVVRLFTMLIDILKSQVVEMRQERDSWRTIALRGANTAESAADVAARQLGMPAS